MKAEQLSLFDSVKCVDVQELLGKFESISFGLGMYLADEYSYEEFIQWLLTDELLAKRARAIQELVNNIKE